MGNGGRRRDEGERWEGREVKYEGGGKGRWRVAEALFELVVESGATSSQRYGPATAALHQAAAAPAAMSLGLAWATEGLFPGPALVPFWLRPSFTCKCEW